ncbi:MAG: hypothetical protein HON90_03055, partial [Halobacteriovoraceae bacterium]|nr:hypothetical protein [Halobacteriovoraceae bacterium]
TGAELGYESGRLFTITNTYYSSSDSDIIKLLLVNNGYSVTVSLEFLTSIGARSFKDYLSANDGVKLAIKHYQKYLNASYEYSWNNFTSRPKKAYMYNIFDYKENEYVRLPWKDYSNKSPIK